MTQQEVEAFAGQYDAANVLICKIAREVSQSRNFADNDSLSAWELDDEFVYAFFCDVLSNEASMMIFPISYLWTDNYLELDKQNQEEYTTKAYVVEEEMLKFIADAGFRNAD